MSAHGGSNSWNLSPSAIAGERQKAASGPLWPACGPARPGPEVVKRPSFCLWRGSAA